MADLMTLSDLAARADEHFTVPVFEAAGLAGFAAAQGAVEVNRYDDDGEPLDPDAVALLVLGWTFDTPASTSVQFDLSPVPGGWFVLSENDASSETSALLHLQGDLSGPGLAAVADALASGLDDGGRFEPPYFVGWPTEVENVHPDLPRTALRHFVRTLSPCPDPFGRETEEFEDVNEEASDPAAVEAAFDRYFARILPPA